MASVSLEVYTDALNQPIVEGETCCFYDKSYGMMFGVVVESRKKVKVCYTRHLVAYDAVTRQPKRTGMTREYTTWVEGYAVVMIRESMLYEILDGETLMAMARMKSEMAEEIQKVLKKKERAKKNLDNLPVGQ